MNRSVLALLLFLFASLFPALDARSQEDLIPDVIVRESDLHNWDIVTDGNRVLLRLATGTPNIGEGPIHIIGLLPANDDGTQNVAQRIYRTDGSYYERDAGRFEFHVGHNHFHLEDWASFRLREILPGDEVGPIIVASEKTSFCLIDSEVHDASLPGFPSTRNYRSCGQSFQGISVGWVDVYGKELIGQNLDIKGVPHGTYWLETEVDPENHILELDETNNITRIKITVGDPTHVDGPLEVVPQDAHVDGHHYPDLRIGTKSDPKTHIGNDIYEPNDGLSHDHHHFAPPPGPKQQTLALEASRKTRKLGFHASLQNESSNINSYIVQCIGGRSNKKLKFKHYDTTGGGVSNVTAAVKTAGLVTTMQVDELRTYYTDVGLSRKMKKRMRKRPKRKRNIHATVAFEAWNASRVDQGWIHLWFR